MGQGRGRSSRCSAGGCWRRWRSTAAAAAARRGCWGPSAPSWTGRSRGNLTISPVKRFLVKRIPFDQPHSTSASRAGAAAGVRPGFVLGRSLAENRPDSREMVKFDQGNGPSRARTAAGRKSFLTRNRPDIPGPPWKPAQLRPFHAPPRPLRPVPGGRRPPCPARRPSPAPPAAAAHGSGHAGAVYSLSYFIACEFRRQTRI